MDLSDLQSQRAGIVEALTEGALHVVFHSGGTRREVEYRSVSELRSALQYVDAAIAKLSGSVVRKALPSFSKGF